MEDDFSLQRLYEIMLKSARFEVIGKANNGEEAIKMYQDFPIKPDVILMDHRMPIKNGIETTKAILIINNHAKIIFASADRSVKDSALTSGAISFLEKPFGCEELINEIKKAVDQVTVMNH